MTQVLKTRHNSKRKNSVLPPHPNHRSLLPTSGPTLRFISLKFLVNDTHSAGKFLPNSADTIRHSLFRLVQFQIIQTNWLTDWGTNEPTKQPSRQLTNQPTNQPTNKSSRRHRVTKKQTKELTDRQPNQPTNQLYIVRRTFLLYSILTRLRDGWQMSRIPHSGRAEVFHSCFEAPRNLVYDVYLQFLHWGKAAGP